ncbi:MAG: hypothetical protein ACO32I_05945 [Candidatus Limnocylindrus sp.]
MHIKHLGAPPLLLATLLFAAGCGSVLDDARGEPVATPTNFNGLVELLAARDFSVSNVVSGDPGCSDQGLVPMAIAFKISGGGTEDTLQARVYRFKNDASYEKLRTSVDACAAEWISDVSTLLMVDASPYVLVTEGVPEGEVADAIRAALREAAGE